MMPSAAYDSNGSVASEGQAMEGEESLCASVPSADATEEADKSMQSLPSGLTIKAPENVQPPYRWNGAGAFPHAYDKNQKTGEYENQLDTSRETTLTLKFTHFPADFAKSAHDNNAYDTDMIFKLILQIKEGDTWKTAKPGHFQSCFKAIPDPGRHRHVIFGQEKGWDSILISLTEDTVAWENIKLNVLSSEIKSTFHGPKCRLLRFKVEGTFADPRIEESRRCVEAHSVEFASVARTISAKEAGKQRLNPPGPTTHKHELAVKEAASNKAARAVHDGRFRSIPIALSDQEFSGATKKLTRKALDTLKKGGGTGGGDEAESEGEEAEDGEEAEAEGEDAEDREEDGEEEEEYESTKGHGEDHMEDHEAEAEGEEAEAPAAMPCSAEVLEGLQKESVAMLDNDPRRHASSFLHRRKPQIFSLYTDAIEIARGLEGKGVNLGEVERARLDSGSRPFNSITNALDEVLHEHLSAAYACVTGGQTFQQGDVDFAARLLKKRIFDKEELSYWEKKLPVLRDRFEETQMQGVRSQINEASQELYLAREKQKAAGEKPLTAAKEFTKAAHAIEAVVRCTGRGLQGPDADLATIVRCSSDVITAALSSISPPPPPSTIGSWHKLLRRVKRVYGDMRVSNEKQWSLRCDAGFLVGELSGDDVMAMERSAALLHTLVKDSKFEGTPSAALPLAASPKLVDGGSGQPEPTMRTFTAVEQSTPSGMVLWVLPAIDAIEGSCETTMYMPIALLSMPPRCILHFIAERSPLPSRPRGSKCLAERALPDALRLLDTFMDDSMSSSHGAKACPFWGHGELHPSTIRKLRGITKRAAALLRGKPEPGPEPEPQAESSHAAVTSGIKLVEGESGVYYSYNKSDICRNAQYFVRYAYNLTLSDGSVREWSNDIYFKDGSDRRRMTQADCNKYYEDFPNQEKVEPWQESMARKKFVELDNEAKHREAIVDIDKYKAKWLAMVRGLSRSASETDSTDTPPLMALSNAAKALAKVEFDSHGNMWLSGGARHYAHTEEGRSKRRTDKSKANDAATCAPVHLDCKNNLEGGTNPVARLLALDVLKSIAVKAKLKVIHLQETVRRSKVGDDDPKGLRTTKRVYFIPIENRAELTCVADVVMDAIEIFRDASRTADQKAWKAAARQHPPLMPASKKRKRSA